jgi:hypothetical protein
MCSPHISNLLFMFRPTYRNYFDHRNNILLQNTNMIALNMYFSPTSVISSFLGPYIVVLCTPLSDNSNLCYSLRARDEVLHSY